MPTLLQAPSRAVRSRVMDSARWSGYRPRADDIIIGTYPKCGTTWMQRIVSMLVFRSAEPKPSMSDWFDMRLYGPIEPLLAAAEARTHRRFLKTHLPLDALPVYAGVKFIHVARDGRDAAMSFHNHLSSFTPEALQRFSEISRNDPKFGDAFPPIPESPAEFFATWIAAGGDALGDEGGSYFEVENAYWAERASGDVLLVHYNDLKADRGGEMRRIADFLDIDIPAALWPELVEAAGFDVMKQQGEALLPGLEHVFEGGADRFLHKGTNGRWRDVLTPESISRYDALVEMHFAPDLARWLEHGRLAHS